MTRRPLNRWPADLVLILIVLALTLVVGCTMIVASGQGSSIEAHGSGPSVGEGPVPQDQRPDVKEPADVP